MCSSTIKHLATTPQQVYSEYVQFYSVGFTLQKVFLGLEQSPQGMKASPYFHTHFDGFHA